MRRRARRKNFVTIGSLPPERLGFSERRTRELRWIEAWTAVAGISLAARVQPVSLRRGVLELRMADPDAGWAATLRELAPALAAELGRRCGEPVRRVRLTSVDGETVGDEPVRGGETVLPRGRREGAAKGARGEDGPFDRARLRRLESRYLERSTEAGPEVDDT